MDHEYFADSTNEGLITGRFLRRKNMAASQRPFLALGRPPFSPVSNSTVGSDCPKGNFCDPPIVIGRRSAKSPTLKHSELSGECSSTKSSSDFFSCRVDWVDSWVHQGSYAPCDRWWSASPHCLAHRVLPAARNGWPLAFPWSEVGGSQRRPLVRTMYVITLWIISEIWARILLRIIPRVFSRTLSWKLPQIISRFFFANSIANMLAKIAIGPRRGHSPQEGVPPPLRRPLPRSTQGIGMPSFA